MSKKQNYDDNWIKKFILSIIGNDTDEITNVCYSENALLRKIISDTRCNMNEANSIYCIMKNLGLKSCIVTSIDKSYAENFFNEGKYNLTQFAQIRGYLNKINPSELI